MFYLSGNFNFNSKHNEFGFVCHSAIIMEMAIDRSPFDSILGVSAVVAFKSDWSYARPWKALVCAYQKPLWFKTKRVCCKRNFSSLSTRNTVCLWHQKISSPPREVVTSTDSRPICTSYLRLVFVLDYFDSESLLRVASYVLRNLPLLWTR